MLIDPTLRAGPEIGQLRGHQAGQLIHAEPTAHVRVVLDPYSLHHLESVRDDCNVLCLVEESSKALAGRGPEVQQRQVPARCSHSVQNTFGITKLKRRLTRRSQACRYRPCPRTCKPARASPSWPHDVPRAGTRASAHTCTVRICLKSAHKEVHKN
eukprot:3557448-Rhodomonas_salina.3